jgi:3-hydroxyacyl-CoA dehydrogenase
MASGAAFSADSVSHVAVLGSGTMGSGIAAHLANLGFQVSLFDVSAEVAAEGLRRARQAKPPHFYRPEVAAQIGTFGLSSDAIQLQSAQWVVEAVSERIEIKHAVYAQIEPFLDPAAVLTTNTSGLEIARLAEVLTPARATRFMGTHFFNPPRYLKLLELIAGPGTDPEFIQAFTDFLEARVARRVVPAKDTPGFIANRYGMWSMYLCTQVAEKLHLRVEQMDAITGLFLGRPKSGTFRLNDLVGLDVMEDIASNLKLRATYDSQVGVLARTASMETLIARGDLGDKTGQGYYKRQGKEFLVLDLVTGAYRQQLDVDFPSLREFGRLPLAERLSKAIDAQDEVGETLRMALLPALRYAEALREEVCYDVRDFDRVMQWGFGWEMGPFQLIDALGPERVGIRSGGPYYSDAGTRQHDGSVREYRPEPEFATLDSFPVVESHPTFRVFDLGDDVRAFTLTTKMGTVTPEAVEALLRWLPEQDGRPLVFGNTGRAFSVGFDLTFFEAAISANDWGLIDQGLRDLQALGELLETQRVVAAVFGYTLGGGFELARSCPQIVAQGEAQIGYPEAKVGLIPGGRGTLQMRMAAQSNAKSLAEMALAMTEGFVAPNAATARAVGFLRPTDVIEHHPDRLISTAKRLAQSVQPRVERSWLSVEGPVTGMIDRGQNERKAAGSMTDYDEVIGDKLKAIFAKCASYDEALARERTEFLDLCGRAFTQARIRHMLEHKVPLRN